MTSLTGRTAHVTGAFSGLGLHFARVLAMHGARVALAGRRIALGRSAAAAPAITSDPQRRGGRPCIRDLRISVGDVLGWLAQGQTPEEIVAEFPELTTDDIRASLEYAAARESHEVRLATAV